MSIGSQNTVLSLGRFCQFLQSRLQEEKGARYTLFRYVLKKVRRYPELQTGVSLDQVVQYKEVLECIYLIMTPMINSERDAYWALSVPLSPVIFYGTKAFYHFLTDKEGCLRGSIVRSMDDETKEQRIRTILYSLALERLYGYDLPTKLEVIQHLSTGTDEISRSFRIQFDARFVDVRFLGDTLPAVDPGAIKVHDNIIEPEILAQLEKKLPVHALCFEGFSIVSVTDITAEKAIEDIKSSIVSPTTQDSQYDDIALSIRSLIGLPAVQIRLIPMLRVNDRLVIDSYGSVGKKLRDICKRNNIAEQVYLSAIENFYQHPVTILDKDVTMAGSTPESKEMYQMLVAMDIKGFLIQPIYFNKRLVGLLEVFSKEPGVIKDNTLSQLEPVTPLLEQLFQTNIDDFNVSLNNIVKDKFTSLQPSVQWAFTDAAWQYLQQRKLDKKAQIGRVRFEDVYPLYGAVDVRNSSVERNLALRADLSKQLGLLMDLLEKLKGIHFLTIIDEMIFKAQAFLDKIEMNFGADDEFDVKNFLEADIVAFLLHYHGAYHASEELINAYYLAVGPSGIAYANRNDLEASLGLLNATIGSLLERMNQEIQMEYPCFFEKFRSDGVEYDIYIGQSITPHQSFDPMYLKNLRLWQLTSMALVARLTRALIPQMKKKLETTQLIFIHSGTIDIEFRSDEHRFDVEGAYNIRYEMIKKRIDKVHVKDSDERLTQPGKIALIYFQQKDIEEYLSFINYLQQQKVLNEDLEYMELEELQGVAGLKAIRIGVNMETEDIEL